VPAIRYIASVVASGVSLYFIFSLVRFVFIGRRSEGPMTNTLTASAFVAVITSAGLWFWALHRFVNDPDWYFKERLTMGVGVTLCVIALALSRFAAGRTSVSIWAGALIVAPNWIGSIIRD